MDRVFANCQCQNHGPFCLVQDTVGTMWNGSGTHCVFDIRYLLTHPEKFNNPDVLLLYWFMTLALRNDGHMTSRQTTGGFGLASKEAFAGSSAEYILNLLASRNSKGDIVGRWATRAINIVPGGLHWEPGDADYFVTTKDRTRFFARTDHLIVLLRIVVEAQGKTLEVFEAQEHTYACRLFTVWTRDVKIEGIKTKLSFVSAPDCDSMAEVLDKFDISICKVMYDCRGTGMLTTRSDILRQIKVGEATVKDFLVPYGSPDKFECNSIANTLHRMKKYGDRGYTFLNYPRFIRRASQDELNKYVQKKT